MLRGINVGGQKLIKMEDLKQLYVSWGFENVQTYIQSGNVIFDSSGKNISGLAKKIEKNIKSSFGFEVNVLIRTKEDFLNIIRDNPFRADKIENIYITFLSETPLKIPFDEINKVKDATEKYFFSEKEIYLFCPNGYGKTKLSNNYFEKKLKVFATTRNLKTINKLFLLTE